MKKFLVILLSILMLCSMSVFAVLAAEESGQDEGQSWQQFHMSTGMAEINDETGVSVFTNTVNGDTSFGRADTQFGMNGLKIKLKYGFQDKTASDPNALVAPPTVESTAAYRMGFRLHLTSRCELNDTNPQIILRFMPFEKDGNTNLTTVNCWTSTGTGLDAGVWAFADANPAPFYWDESQSNEISFEKRSDGKFWLTVNGDSQPFHEYVNDEWIPYRNMDAALAKFDNGNGYFVFWNNYSETDKTKYASKVTVESISSELPQRFETGSPYGYAFETGKEAVWGYDAAGKPIFQAKDGAAFTVTETSATRSLTGTGIEFRIKKESGSFSMNLVADAANAKLLFEKGTAADTAKVSLVIGGETKSVENVMFRWHGETKDDYAINKVLVYREKSDFRVSVNDVVLDSGTDGLDTERLADLLESLGASSLQLESTGAGEFVLDGFITKLPASTPAGWQVGTDGETKWDSDFDGNSVVWAEDGVFSAAYQAEPAAADMFGVRLILESEDVGKGINVILSSSKDYYKGAGGAALLFNLAKGEGNVTDVKVRLYTQENGITDIVSGTLTTMNWSASQEVPVQFGIAEGEWSLYVRSTKVALDSAKLKTAAETVLAECENNMAYFQVSSEGGGKNAVTFLGMLHYLPGPAVIDGIQSNSSFPVFGAPKEEGDLVMTYSANKGDTINIINKEVYVDGFKMTFDIFATPQANMGHIVIALAVSTNWHSLDTGIQFAITSAGTDPTDLTKANFGLNMTDAQLGLSNSPLVTYDIPFNWRGTNTIELNKEAEKWVLKVNGTPFNTVGDTTVEELAAPVKQGDTVVAETITEILDVVIERYDDNYSYFQMWNNFGAFTMSITDMNMMAINVAPTVKPGIVRDFTAPLDYKVRLDLNKFFTDSDGEIVEFTADGGAAIVEGHILEYTVSSEGEKKYINVRAYDDRGDFGLVRISVQSGSLNLGGMNVDGEPNVEESGGGCNSALGGACVAGAAVMLCAAAALTIKRRRFER